MRLNYNRHLFRSAEEEAQYGQTHIGQASWALGPDTCFDCTLFYDVTRNGGLCRKFEELTGREGIRFPGAAPACRFWLAKRRAARRSSPPNA
jgi:hypothetical protein